MKINGKYFKRIRVKGDGHCGIRSFFVSLLTLYSNPQAKNWINNELDGIKEIRIFLQKNGLKYYEQEKIGNLEIEENINELKKSFREIYSRHLDMHKCGSSFWLQEVHLISLAKKYKVNIVIFAKHYEHQKQSDGSYSLESVFRNFNKQWKTVYLLNENNTHYDTLIPKPKSKLINLTESNLISKPNSKPKSKLINLTESNLTSKPKSKPKSKLINLTESNLISKHINLTESNLISKLINLTESNPKSTSKTNNCGLSTQRKLGVDKQYKK
tara:strand:- start:293 stop:1105 length:813 start_codon:yes stop_codon:yes gene_type:complete